MVRERYRKDPKDVKLFADRYDRYTKTSILSKVYETFEKEKILLIARKGMHRCVDK